VSSISTTTSSFLPLAPGPEGAALTSSWWASTSSFLVGSAGGSGPANLNFYTVKSRIWLFSWQFRANLFM
jgi:hypothetical protein